ncbi:uncharacterized protein NEMAJ01_0255 [Nematocida major]|uniref:uncharacterized protein n=1 Tax=Nematocida major TaxID=1912982 RepID=UPI002007E254|nr:uncharacterized protein NEMAJ01_0255 [Nematocida major]KAH9385359.1 hypothetical protein NEMAJ01_0255 [Nematocida major]
MHRLSILGLLAASTALAAHSRIIIEPEIYKNSMYISAVNFKLQKYISNPREPTEKYSQNTDVHQPIDLDSMTFIMEDKSNLYESAKESSELEKEKQIFTFQNKAGNYMTGFKDKFITMEPRQQNNIETQLWHLTLMTQGDYHVIYSMDSPNMCLTLVPLESITRKDGPTNTVLGSNLKLSLCKPEKPEQKFIIRRIQLSAEEQSSASGTGKIKPGSPAENKIFEMLDRMDQKIDNLRLLVLALVRSVSHIQQIITTGSVVPGEATDIDRLDQIAMHRPMQDGFSSMQGSTASEKPSPGPFPPNGNTLNPLSSPDRRSSVPELVSLNSNYSDPYAARGVDSPGYAASPGISPYTQPLVPRGAPLSNQPWRQNSLLKSPNGPNDIHSPNARSLLSSSRDPSTVSMYPRHLSPNNPTVQDYARAI